MSDEARELFICPASDEEVVDKLLVCIEALTQIDLYAYQALFARRVVESVLANEGASITALWCRQSGKTETVANVCIGLAVMLPAMHGAFPDDPRFLPFKNGFLVGVYAPIDRQAKLSFSRMRGVVSSEHGERFMSDPEIGVAITSNRSDFLGFSNGSEVIARTASPDAQIEGETHHLVICVAGDTRVVTPDGAVPISALVESGYAGKVLAFSHNDDSVVWADVLACQCFEGADTYRVTFDDGSCVVATGDHLWWIDGFGYAETRWLASSLGDERDNDSVRYAVDAVQVRGGQARGLFHLPKELHSVPANGHEPLLFCGLPEGAEGGLRQQVVARRVVSVEACEAPALVYDLTTSTGNFFANGVLTHNCEEAQRLSRTKVEKEITPMLASTNGTMVKIGTAWHSRGGFHVSIQKNIEQRRNGGKRAHFEFPYDIVVKEKRAAYEHEEKTKGVGNPFHLLYERFIDNEITRLGGIDSDEFRMNYRCVWQESRVIAINLRMFRESALLDMESGTSQLGFQVAGLDIGKTEDSTVLTTMLVEKDRPIINKHVLPGAEEEKQVYHRKVILDWVEMGGSFEGNTGQYAQLVNYLIRTRVQVLVVDATSLGNPVFERIQAMLEGQITVVPFVFSVVSKHDLYKYYLQELHSGRIRYTAGAATKQRVEYQRFTGQHETLDRIQHGQFLTCEAPDGEHDDYPDSAALACWAEKIADSVMMPEMVVSGVASGAGGQSSSGRSGGAGRYQRRR